MEDKIWKLKVNEQRQYKDITKKELFNFINEFLKRENFEVITKKKVDDEKKTKGQPKWRKWTKKAQNVMEEREQKDIYDDYTLKAKEKGFAALLRKECMIHCFEENSRVSVDLKLYAQPQKKGVALGITSLPVAAAAGGASFAKYKLEMKEFVKWFWDHVDSFATTTQSYQDSQELNISTTIECEKCGKELDSNEKFCPECGTKVEVKTNTCPNCGVTVDENAKFCIECGASLVERNCPSCGNKIERDMKFCSECGAQL